MYDLFAYGIQHPFEIWGVYIIAYSPEEGTGKDTLIDFYGDLFMDYYSTTNPKRILGQFNEHMAYKPFVKLGETGIPKEGASKLRGVITDPRIDIEGKGLKGGNMRIL